MDKEQQQEELASLEAIYGDDASLQPADGIVEVGWWILLSTGRRAEAVMLCALVPARLRRRDGPPTRRHTKTPRPLLRPPPTNARPLTGVHPQPQRGPARGRARHPAGRLPLRVAPGGRAGGAPPAGGDDRGGGGADRGAVHTRWVERGLALTPPCVRLGARSKQQKQQQAAAASSKGLLDSQP